MKTQFQAGKKNHQTNMRPSVRPIKKRGPGMSHPPACAKILQLQRVIGNRAVGERIRRVDAFGNSAQICPGTAAGRLPLVIRARPMPAVSGQILQRQKHTPVAEFTKRKLSLERELRRINKIADASRRKKSRQAFLKKILLKVLHHNPFARIKVKKISGTARAETEWINPAKKSAGIQCAFDEDIFKDPLVLIIATLIHESAHADQLKAGMEYYPDPTLTPIAHEKIYRKAVYYLAEADARLDTLYKFFKALPKTYVKQVMKETTDLIQKADKFIGRMNAAVFSYRGRHYQRKLTALFTGKKLKRGGKIKAIWKRDKAYLGLKNDLLPWRRLP
jgi:hypothetical protein